MAVQLGLVLPYIMKALAAANVAKGVVDTAGVMRQVSSILKKGGVADAKSLVTALNGIVSGNGLPYLGKGGGKKFMDSAMSFFLSQYLPQMMMQGGLNGTRVGQLLLGYDKMMPGDRGFVMGEGSLSHPWDTREYTFGSSGPTVSGPFGRGGAGGGSGGSGGPVGKWFGGTPGTAQRMFGWGGSAGSGGWSAEELLRKLVEDPMSVLGQQLSAPQAEGGAPFAEEGAWRDFLREQKAKDAEFEAELNRRLDKNRQEYVDEKMSRYYRKPGSQWAKELATEGFGRLAQGFGEGFNVYNSALANALMQSAAGAMTSRQAEMYGNPLMSGMTLLAGGRQALGGIANVAGKQLGNFFRDWSDDIASEFENQRITRLQLDNRQPGQVIDTLGRIGMRRREGRRE